MKGLGDNVLHELYSRADLFFFPSRYEGHSLVILEALAAGCPVLSTKSAKPENVINGINGYVLETEKIDEAVMVIEKHFALPETEKEKIRENARKTMEDYGLKEHAKQYMCALLGGN